MGQLDGKVAVIAGATAGIGMAIAKRFRAESAYVSITGRRQSALDEAVREIGRDVTGWRGDVPVIGGLDRLYSVVREHLATVIPVGRIGRPEEVASAALFLASGESSFIAGIELIVGGMSQI